LPKKSDRQDFKIIGEYFDKVVELGHKRNNDEKQMKNQNYYAAKAYLIRRIYWFTKSHLKKNSPSDFREQARQAEFDLDFRSAKNPFNLMIAIFGEYEGISFNRSQRSKYARALSYAYEHDVHHKWIQGFILQAGGLEQAAAKFETKKYEKWLDTRINKKRSLRNIDFTNPKHGRFRRV